MSNKNEILKIGLLTALVAFGMIGVFAAVSAPGDGIESAHAMKKNCGPGGHGGPGGQPEGGIPCGPVLSQYSTLRSD